MNFYIVLASVSEATTRHKQCKNEWWTNGELNPTLSNANAAYYRYTTGPLYPSECYITRLETISYFIPYEA
jgi:hypothetical protein